MPDLPWNEPAIATRTTLDGLREIIKEGSLREVVRHIDGLHLEPGGLRVSLPDRRELPTSWFDTGVTQLVQAYCLAFPAPKGHGASSQKA